MCSYVALRQHKEQSTSHLFFVEWEQSATQHNETTYPNCTRQNENGTKWLSRKASTRLLPAAFIVIEQHWPKIKSCCSYRVFMKSICQITFSVVSRFSLTAAARIGRDEQKHSRKPSRPDDNRRKPRDPKTKLWRSSKNGKKKAARETVEPKADERRKQQCEPKSGGERQQPSSRLTLTESIFWQASASCNNLEIIFFHKGPAVWQSKRSVADRSLRFSQLPVSMCAGPPSIAGLLLLLLHPPPPTHPPTHLLPPSLPLCATRGKVTEWEDGEAGSLVKLKDPEMPPKARRAMKRDQWSRAATIYRCGGRKKKRRRKSM